MPYCAYLRKSRADVEAEAHGEGETLARHERRLLDLAQHMHLTLTQIYREIISGDTIADRPIMQRLLHEVESGLWDGVLVVEVERLARGDSVDQGVVARTFKFSGTKIITPMKVYDPLNEFDEEYFEFGLFMSRREYKIINRRLQAGRLASAREGKWLGGPNPFGYRSVKIKNGKGHTLEIVEEEAEVVRELFRLYAYGDEGTVKIANRMNLLGYRSSKGLPFNVQIVKEILRNPVYHGSISYGRRRTEKAIEAGAVRKTCPRHSDYQIYQGLHTPIIDDATWNAVQHKLRSRSFSPVRQHTEMKNIFAGLLFCANCGHPMQRRISRGKSAVYCYRFCGSVGSFMDEVERAVLQTLHEWLAQYRVSVVPQHDEAQALRKNDSSLSRAKSKLRSVHQQAARCYALLEQEIYTTAVFLERQRALDAEKAALQTQIRQLEQAAQDLNARASVRNRIVPQLATVLDAYSEATTAKEKNRLLKSVIARIEYRKTVSCSHKQLSDMSLRIIPQFLPPFQ